MNRRSSAVFKRYPNIRWVFAHAGGTLPYLAFRIALGSALNEFVANNVPDGPPAYYARVYYDTTVCPSRSQTAVPAASAS